MNYIGLTYPGFLSWKPLLFVWKKVCCPGKMHLFDEVLSETHYFHCDACGFRIGICKTEEGICLDI